MSRADWCALRGVAGCERAILPIIEIAASRSMNAAVTTHIEPGEVIVSKGAGTIVDNAKHGGTTVSFFIIKCGGDVSEAGSKLTDLVVPE